LQYKGHRAGWAILRLQLSKESWMTDRIALILAIIIVLLILVDVVLNDAAALTFLLRKLVDMIEYVAFWR
jgi:uncharacterized membrane protein YobD (UPF0266 family)